MSITFSEAFVLLPQVPQAQQIGSQAAGTGEGEGLPLAACGHIAGALLPHAAISQHAEHAALREHQARPLIEASYYSQPQWMGM